MKRKLVVAALAVAIGALFGACGNRDRGVADEEKTNGAAAADAARGVEKVDSFPWNFPRDFALKDVKRGQMALSPAAFYGGAIQRGENLATTLLPVYNAIVEKVGPNTMTLASMGQEVDVPHALVITFPKEQKVQNGDVVLTWWQSGEGMQRAIVIDDTKQQKPKVCYLDLDYNADGRGFANSHANEELMSGSFKVLNNGEWTSGASVAVEENGLWKGATILNIQGNNLLLVDAESRITTAERARCRLVPITTDYDVGDLVFARLTNTFEPNCKVMKVDKRVGRVWVEKNGATAVVSILNVMCHLDAQP